MEEQIDLSWDKEERMDGDQMKRLLASISIAGLAVGGGVAGKAFSAGEMPSSKSVCGGASKTPDEDKRMEGHGSWCAGMKKGSEESGAVLMLWDKKVESP